MAAVALLLAAGRGERLGGSTPKAFVELAGRPLLQWSLDVLAESPAIERIVVTRPEGAGELPEQVRLPDGALCVEGAAVRSASVRRALRAAGAGDPVLVHDAARPLVSVELVERTLAACANGVDGAIAAARVSDTVKRAAGEPPVVQETLDRSGLWAVQTPQVFKRASLEQALAVPDEVLAAATDDAWLVERMGGRVAIVESSPANLKITTAIDLHIAEALLGAPPHAGQRCRAAHSAAPDSGAPPHSAAPDSGAPPHSAAPDSA